MGQGVSMATLNAGSNTISLIGQTGVIQTIDAGGLRPVSGFAGDFDNNGFTDLVVGDNGDGRFTLFTGSEGGLNLIQTITSEDVPSPTSLSFAGVTDGVLSFYASTMGREAATLLAFNLEAGGSITGEGLAGGTEQSAGATLASATAGVFQQVAQLLGRSGSPLDLVAPLFTVSVMPGEFDLESSGEGGLALLASFTPGAGPGPVAAPERRWTGRRCSRGDADDHARGAGRGGTPRKAGRRSRSGDAWPWGWSRRGSRSGPSCWRRRAWLPTRSIAPTRPGTAPRRPRNGRPTATVPGRGSHQRPR